MAAFTKNIVIRVKRRCDAFTGRRDRRCRTNACYCFGDFARINAKTGTA
jgi:hypothetical protein